MTNDLCEKSNGTLKYMLKIFVAQDPKGWDKYIPYLLFASCEVSLHLSFFIAGKPERHWTYSENAGLVNLQLKCGLAEYIFRMRQWLDLMANIAKENKQNAQVMRKTWYDRATRDCSFEKPYAFEIYPISE